MTTPLVRRTGALVSCRRLQWWRRNFVTAQTASLMRLTVQGGLLWDVSERSKSCACWFHLEPASGTFQKRLDRCSGAKFSVGPSACLITLHHPCQSLPPRKSNWPPDCLPPRPETLATICELAMVLLHSSSFSGMQGQPVWLFAFCCSAKPAP